MHANALPLIIQRNKNMENLTSYTSEDQGLSHSSVDPAIIDDLIAELASHEGSKRQRARDALAAIGKPAVAPLLQVLGDRRNHTMRWEAAKTLSEIADLDSAPVLIATLEDGDFDIRWLAAEGLIAMGRAAWPPLLRALIQRAGSVWLRNGAHHILTSFFEPEVRALLAPVILALEGGEPELTVPSAAQRLLRTLLAPNQE
jgi:HEAT repeat protein